MFLRLVGPVQAIEIGRHLDRSVAVQGRTRRHTIVDLDRKLRFLERFIEIGKRQQCKRMIGDEEERKLQIHQAQVLTASPAKRCAEAIKCLSGTGLNVGNQCGNFSPALSLSIASTTSGWRGSVLSKVSKTVMASLGERLRETQLP